jgi:hypothetical protein
MLGANSKDQVKFVHYDIMRDIIFNSPNLLDQVGKKNIQEKEIRLKDKRGRVNSLIRSISSFSGIVSNITGYTFSEIFDMKNPRFFVQLDGSIRNMPNALGVIDSTVSDKLHVLYQLYFNYLTNKTKTVYFSYRSSKLGLPEDYWNPQMDADQLNDYRAKFPFGEFERYFLNLWSAGTIRVFTDEMLEETMYLGIDGQLMNHEALRAAIGKKQHLLTVKADAMEHGFQDGVEETDAHITDLQRRMIPVEKYCSLRNKQNLPMMASVESLETLSEKLDTDWAVGVGIDMADPMAVRSKARTIVTLVAKGLLGSKKNPWLYDVEGAVPHYLYFLIHAVSVENHSLESCKKLIEDMSLEFDGVDTLCGERWGIWDFEPWCEERAIAFDPIYPTYDRQREGFKELYTIIDQGRLKVPPLAIPGAKTSDIFREEASMFDHDPEKRWFGSPEKNEKYGVQDDFIYSLSWCIYGLRFTTPTDFRNRRGKVHFGTFVAQAGLTGKY